ncbi:MAG: hypothetical protein ABII79_09310 [bacterium]
MDNLNKIRELIDQIDDAKLVDLISSQRKRLQLARQEVKEAKAELDFLEQVFQFRHARRAGDPIVRITDPKDPLQKIEATEFKRDNMVTAVERILTKGNRTLTVDEIVHCLRLGGFPFRVKDPATSVEVVLNRNKDKFFREEPHVFRLRDDGKRGESTPASPDE